MKKIIILIFICLFLFVCFCSTYTIKQKQKFTSPVWIVKQTFPDAFILEQMPDYHYILIMENNNLGIVAVDKIKLKVVQKWLFKDIPKYKFPKLRNYLCYEEDKKKI